MPTLWQNTITLFIFENKGALYEHFVMVVKRTPCRLQKGRISCNDNRCQFMHAEVKWPATTIPSNGPTPAEIKSISQS
jgi:hypothetical protein